MNEWKGFLASSASADEKNLFLYIVVYLNKDNRWSEKKNKTIENVLCIVFKFNCGWLILLFFCGGFHSTSVVRLPYRWRTALLPSIKVANPWH